MKKKLNEKEVIKNSKMRSKKEITRIYLISFIIGLCIFVAVAIYSNFPKNALVFALGGTILTSVIIFYFAVTIKVLEKNHRPND